MKTGENTEYKIGLLGASFDTGNLGVSALAESSIKVILNKWPNAQVTLIGNGYEPKEHNLLLCGKQLCIKSIPIRFSKNIFLPCHFLKFVFYGLMMKILPGAFLKNALLNRNLYFKSLYELDIAADITGGDSFSDIYGSWRFLNGFFIKWLMIFLGKKLFFLPQTYGPFQKRGTKILAKYILKRSSMIYSRDRESLEYVRHLLNYHNENGKVRYVPDIAFILDSHKPEHIDVGTLLNAKKESSILIGINISGLLFNGGYTNNNMFGLKTSYSSLIFSVIESLLENKSVTILLIPHVFPPADLEIESDPDACKKVYNKLGEKYENRIFVVQGNYNHNEIKYIIGLCDFFIGSRMHSCVAALSQMIPAVGLAYSKKFSGVFESIDMGELVIDLRSQEESGILLSIQEAIIKRETIKSKLLQQIPIAQKAIFNTFSSV